MNEIIPDINSAVFEIKRLQAELDAEKSYSRNYEQKFHAVSGECEALQATNDQLATALNSAVEALNSANERVHQLESLINTPETSGFLDGVKLEAAHQVERWGSQHDAGKAPQDWFWLIGYLAGKALRAAIDGDIEKAKHHCVSTGAICANWHGYVCGNQTTFRPGLGPDSQETKPSAPQPPKGADTQEKGDG